MKTIASFLKTIEFLSPENLYLLLPMTGLLIITGIAIHYVLRKRFNLFILRSRAKEFARLRSTVSWLAKFCFLGLTLTFLVLTLSRPQSIQPEKHRNFVFVVDSSRSMSVADYHVGAKPCNRLIMTQWALDTLVNELPPESTVTVLSFVGGAVGGAVVSENKPLLRTLPLQVGSCRKELIEMINWISWNQATEAGTAIQGVVRRLAIMIKDKPDIFEENPIIILISDGEENVPDYDPNSHYITMTGAVNVSLELFKNSKVQFLIVGVGTPAGAPIPVFDEDWLFKNYESSPISSKPTLSKRNDKFLAELAKKLKADYVKLKGPDDLKFLAKESRYKTAVSQVPKDLTFYSLFAALLCFLAAIVL